MQDETVVYISRELTISEMARLHGVSLRTLRFYEQIGLLVPRRDGPRRMYSPQDEARLKLVLTGKKFGFSLREIGNMIRDHVAKAKGEPGELAAVLDRDTVRRQLSSLQSQKADVETAIAELKARLG